MTSALRRIEKARKEKSRVLDLSGLLLRDVPSEIEDLSAHLEELILFNNQLSKIPLSVFKLVKLRALDFSSNLIREIPVEIKNFKSLRKLIARHNIISRIDPAIGELKEIRDIELQNNSLTEIPAEIFSACGLSKIDLTNNAIQHLPTIRFRRSGVSELSIKNNNLRTIHSTIRNLKNLEVLDVSQNNLSILPPDISQLTDLKSLNISHNPIYELPKQIISNRKLKDLSASGTSLPESYGLAMRAGLEALMSFLGSLKKESEPLFEAKIVITGEGRVGKTTLLSALSRKSPGELRTDNTTWGVDRTTFDLEHPEIQKQKITFNAWDFGGQNVYRSTHQFFFSDQAIYLLVWNPRSEIETIHISNWLRTIALRTGSNLSFEAPETEPARPRAKVILVATHCDAPGGAYSADFGLSGLDRDLQAMIVGSIHVDSLSGRNIDVLASLIAVQATQLPEMGAQFNVKWAKARRKISEMAHQTPWVRFDELRAIYREHGIPDETDMRTLTSVFLHRLGLATWYGSVSGESETDPILEDTVVLDAEWLSRAFVQLLEDEATVRSGGIFSNVRYSEVWTDHGRKDWRKFSIDEYPRLARLLRQFDVAIPTRNSLGERSLVPQLVPPGRPDLPWDELAIPEQLRCIRMRFELDHRADGLISRIIASTEPYHLYQKGVGLFWKRGIFLRDSASFKNDALILITGMDRPTIEVICSGEQPGFMCTDLNRVLSNIFQFWPGLTYRTFVMCPTRNSKTDFCDFGFSFDSVLRRSKSTGSSSIDCHQCDRVFEASDLLFGISNIGMSDDYVIKYLYQRERTPCPRILLFRPVEKKRGLRNRSWSDLVGRRYYVALVSEFSGIQVAEKEIIIKSEWVEWLSGFTKYVSAFLPLMEAALEGDLLDNVKSARSIVNGLSNLPLNAEDGYLNERFSSETHTALNIDEALLFEVCSFLDDVGLDPRKHGMDIVRTRDRGWLWMSAEEASIYRPQDALLN